jgi:hypothetical protein
MRTRTGLAIALALYGSFVCAPIATASSGSEAEPYSLELDCLVQEPCTLVVYVVDEDSFKRPRCGLREARLVLGKGELASGRVGLSFSLPAGIYGIRAFIDTNGNGTLDRGPFGPTEPWGMSWRGPRELGFPRFSDIAFALEGNLSGIEVELAR